MTTPNNYSNTASVAQLGASMDAVTTTSTINAATYSGFPGAPYWAEIARGTPSAEVVEVTAVSGTALTVVRGQGGTAASAHSAGDAFEHIAPAAVFQTSEAHIATGTSVHAIPTGASVVGTQGAQVVQDKTYRGAYTHDFNDANPAGVAAGFQVVAETSLARDAFVVTNTGADNNRYSFLSTQSGSNRFELFNDGTMKVTPAGLLGRYTLDVEGTLKIAQLATFVNGINVVGGISTINGTLTLASPAITAGTVTGSLVFPLQAAGATGTLVTLNGRTGQHLIEGYNASAVKTFQLAETGNVDTNGYLSSQSFVQGYSGKWATTNTNTGHDWGSQSQLQLADGSTNVTRDSRHSLVWGVRKVNLGYVLTGSDTTIWSFTFTPRTTCEMKLNLSIILNNAPGGSGSNYEPSQATLGWKLQSPDGATTYYTSDEVLPYNGQGSPSWTKGGNGSFGIDYFTPTLTAGTQYKFVLVGSASTVLKPSVQHILGTMEECTFLGYAAGP